MSDPGAALARLVHGEAFRFLSEVVALVPGESAEGVWRVAGTEAFFAGHFPSCPVVPGVLIAEALAQLSGLAAFAAEDDRQTPIPGLLAHVNVRFQQLVRPPAAVHLRSKLTRRLGEVRLFEVEAVVDGRTAAQGTLALARGDVQGAGS